MLDRTWDRGVDDRRRSKKWSGWKKRFESNANKRHAVSSDQVSVIEYKDPNKHTTI